MYAKRLVLLYATAKLYAALVALVSAYGLYPYVGSTELLLSDPQDAFDKFLREVLAPFARWDAVYFVSIAKDGYQFEQQHAFFPLLPLLLRLGGQLFQTFGISLLTGYVITGVLLVNLLHFLTIINIFK